MVRDIPNPYREEASPDLHAAWDEGFRAYLAGEAVPEEHRKRPAAASNAWLNGYTAARLSSGSSTQSGPARAEE